jgi:hypothetical protein
MSGQISDASAIEMTVRDWGFFDSAGGSDVLVKAMKLHRGNTMRCGGGKACFRGLVAAYRGAFDNSNFRRYNIRNGVELEREQDLPTMRTWRDCPPDDWFRNERRLA